MKKKILSFALAGSLMLGLTGCGQKSDPNPGSKKGYDEGEQYVSIWVHSIEDTDEGRAYRQSVNAFNKKYNGKYFADIEFIPRNDSGGGYTDKINASVMSGGLPDVLTVDGPNISSYAHNNIIAPLVDVTKKEKSEYLNSIIEQGTVDGKLYALGAMESSVGLYYNKDILDKAGVTVPDQDHPWTFSEFLNVLEKVKKVTDQSKGYLLDMTFPTGEATIYYYAPFSGAMEEILFPRMDLKSMASLIQRRIQKRLNTLKSYVTMAICQKSQSPISLKRDVQPLSLMVPGK